MDDPAAAEINTAPAHSRARQLVDGNARLLTFHSECDVDVACWEREERDVKEKHFALTKSHVTMDGPAEGLARASSQLLLDPSEQALA